jgi:hypothetical protein
VTCFLGDKQMRLRDMIVISFVACLATALPARADSIVRDAALSPNGRLLALELENGDKHVVAISDSANADAPTRSLDVSSQTVTSMRWADDGFLLIHTTQRGPGTIDRRSRQIAKELQVRRSGRTMFGMGIEDIDFASVYALDVSTMRAVQLLGDTPDVAITPDLGNVAPTPYGRAGTVTMRAPIWVEADRRTIAVISIWRVDLRTGRGEIVQRGHAQTTGWVVDNTGAVIARVDHEDSMPIYRIKPYSEGRESGAAVNATFEADAYPLFRSLQKDGRTVEVLVGPKGAVARDGRAMLFDLATGALRAHDAPGVSAGTILYDERSGLVAGAQVGGNALYVDAARAQIYAQLKQAFVGARVEIISTDSAGDRHVVRTRSTGKEEWFLYSDKAKSAELIGVGAVPAP